MSIAAVTPRVRTIVICDDVFASPIENGVFTLEGVRVQLEARVLPLQTRLTVFLLLSSARKGKYSGKILVANDRTDKLIRYVKFSSTFHSDNELLVQVVEIGECVFSEAGTYTFAISFANKAGDEALKGEHPLTVLTYEV